MNSDADLSISILKLLFWDRLANGTGLGRVGTGLERVGTDWDAGQVRTDLDVGRADRSGGIWTVSRSDGQSDGRSR